MRIRVCDAIMGAGKAQPLDSLVLASHGFVNMGDIRVGDKIFGEDGELHDVLGVYPQGKKPVFGITFNDGSYVECCEEHLWTYQLPQDRCKGIFRTDTLGEIMKSPLYHRTNRGDRNWQFYIPLTKPTKFGFKGLRVDPYVLGVLLGDGYMGSPENSLGITNLEDDVINKFQERLYSGLSLNGGEAGSYRIVDNEPVKQFAKKGACSSRIRQDMRCLGLFEKKSWEKFIPEMYLAADVSVRTELLCGLLDTDGDVNRGSVSYSTTSWSLSRDVQFLIQSLGGTAKISERRTRYTYQGELKYGRLSYRLNIKLPLEILSKLSSKHRGRLSAVNVSPHRTIRKIEFAGEKDCQCIMVSNPSGLYLTNGFVVTHNTSAAINHMNTDTESNFIFITPYLREVERIKESCESRGFKSPEHRGMGKLENLHQLLNAGENIASTHMLFSAYNDETIRAIQSGGKYKLILDEVFCVIETLELKKDDLKALLASGFIEVVEEKVIWLFPDYKGSRFADVKLKAESGNLYFYDNSLLFWSFPVEIFFAFEEVTILTYLFQGQIQKYYCDLNKIEVEYIGTVFDNDTYVFSETPVVPDYTRNLINKVHILDNDRMNAVGDGKTALSASWFKREKKKSGKPMINQLKNNVYNLFRNVYKTPSEVNMWTTFKDNKSILSGKGYTGGFVAYNARATNDFKDKTHLAYCANVFFHPFFKRYFADHGIHVQEDLYALSEIVQWVWRSAIRDGRDVWIYIPSSRMRNLLRGWLRELNEC